MPPAAKPRLRSSMFPGARGSLGDHLAAADGFVRLSEQANRLRRLQNLLDAELPPHLLPGTHVANIKRGTVVIHTASGAVAVKLRQLAPRLAEGFRQQGQEVTGIEVRVQARRSPTAALRPRKPKTLGLPAKQALASLASGLDEGSPIRRAVERLLRN